MSISESCLKTVFRISGVLALHTLHYEPSMSNESTIMVSYYLIIAFKYLGGYSDRVQLVRSEGIIAKQSPVDGRCKLHFTSHSVCGAHYIE